MVFFGDPTGNRTRVTAVKGRCLDRLTIGPCIKRQLLSQLLPVQNRQHAASLHSSGKLRFPSLSRFVRFAKKDSYFRSCLFYKTGNVLLSQAVSHQVSSALGSLTSVFEMGTGVSSPLLLPDFLSLLLAAFCLHRLFLLL